LFSEETVFAMWIFYMALCYVVCFEPEKFMDPINNMPADPSQTPPHITPEWYFLPFYTILRVSPTKVSGILLMGASILVLFVLPFMSIPEFKKSKSWKFLFITFVFF
jgi:quinol-cytochrome oxidoreductase complex cytochrome b subunit